LRRREPVDQDHQRRRHRHLRNRRRRTAGGGITSITAGTGLSGGTITTSGTIAIAAGGVGATQINSTQVQRRNVAMAIGCAGSNLSIKTINEDGSVTCETDETGSGGGGSGWGLTGNSLTGSEFLGATNLAPVVIKSNNQRVAQLLSVPNVTGVGSGVNVLMGSPANVIDAGIVGGTIAGGGLISPTGAMVPNHVTGQFGTIGGGYDNDAGFTATVSGGYLNQATGQSSSIAGGTQNVAADAFSSILGGSANMASGLFSVVAGGKGNTAAPTTAPRSATAPTWPRPMPEPS
jgi:hypothetical protein